MMRPLYVWISFLCFQLSIFAAEPTIILNIGDSITQGIVERGDYSKPLNLELKYNNYVVLNLGNSGKAMSRLLTSDYRKTVQFQAALKIPANVVTIMLGTNDARAEAPDPTRNFWERVNGTFAADTLELVETFRAMPSKPEVWLCTPPPASNDNKFYIKGRIIHDEQIPLLVQVARENAIPVIDIWNTELVNHLGDGKGDPATSGTLANDYYTDGVHPTRLGNTIIGKKIAAMLTKPKPEVMIYPCDNAVEKLPLFTQQQGAEYQWYRDGKAIDPESSGTQQILGWTGPGKYKVAVRLNSVHFDTLVSDEFAVPVSYRGNALAGEQ